MAAALSFLQINADTAWPEGEEMYQAMIAIAEKRLDKTGLAELFRRAANSAS
jgi:prophage maintenance system killer protein